MLVWMIYDDRDVNDVNRLQRAFYRQSIPKHLRSKCSLDNVSFSRFTDEVGPTEINSKSLLLVLCSENSLNNHKLNHLLTQFKMRSKHVFVLVVSSNSSESEHKQSINTFFPPALTLDIDEHGNDTGKGAEPVAVHAGQNEHTQAIAVSKFTAAIFDLPYRELTQRQKKSKQALALVILGTLIVSVVTCADERLSDIDKLYEDLKLKDSNN